MSATSLKYKSEENPIPLKVITEKRPFSSHQALMQFDVANRSWRETLSLSFKND